MLSAGHNPGIPDRRREQARFPKLWSELPGEKENSVRARCDVGHWPLADVAPCTAHVRFRGQSGHLREQRSGRRPSAAQAAPRRNRTSAHSRSSPRSAALPFDMPHGRVRSPVPPVRQAGLALFRDVDDPSQEAPHDVAGIDPCYRALQRPPPQHRRDHPRMASARLTCLPQLSAASNELTAAPAFFTLGGCRSSIHATSVAENSRVQIFLHQSPEELRKRRAFDIAPNRGVEHTRRSIRPPNALSTARPTSHHHILKRVLRSLTFTQGRDAIRIVNSAPNSRARFFRVHSTGSPCRTVRFAGFDDAAVISIASTRVAESARAETYPGAPLNGLGPRQEIHRAIGLLPRSSGG